jgi:hypothetical protein
LDDNGTLEEFIIAVRRLKAVSNLTEYDILSIAKKEMTKQPSIPISVFSSNLGILEATVKYMKEAFGMNYAKIASILKRDQRTIWVCYNKACKKDSGKYLIDNAEIEIPVKILADRNKSPLCAISSYLFNLGITKTTIARLLNRKVQNIWYAIQK